MSRFWHVFVQVVATAAQLVNVSAVPVRYQGIAAASLGLIQGGIALYNHK